MCIACWIHEATNMHSAYIILTAFPLQQRLQEHASMVRCTYIGHLVHTNTESVRDLCWTLGQVLLRVHKFFPVSIFPPMFHAHLHLHVALTGWKNGRRLGSLKKSALSEVGKNWIERYFFIQCLKGTTVNLLLAQVSVRHSNQCRHSWMRCVKSNS